MKSSNANMEDTIALMTFVRDMMRGQSKEEVDELRKLREGVYEDYEPEDLKRMIRNVTRMFWGTWETVMAITGQNPDETWQEYCMSFQKYQLENPNDND